jgi:anti-sigma factor RsiW
MTTSNHDLDWNEQLQDWLDGELTHEERARVEAHIESCPSCQQQLAVLKSLDDALVHAAPRLSLDQDFDARLFAQIESDDEARRAAARERVRQELEQGLTKLTRDWRRTLATIIPSVLAGVAIAFGLAEYFDTAAWARSMMAESAGEIGAINAMHLHTILTSAIGAATGYVIARWLTPLES